MSNGKKVAVVGATGAVGIEMMETLEKRNFPVSDIKLLASARSVGKKFKFRGEEITVEELTKDSFKGVDIALFSAGGSISKEFAPACVDAGCVMIDNSSCFRMDDDVPLVVPEVNAEDVFTHKGIIANPNCTTAIMCVVVWPLHKAKGLHKVMLCFCSICICIIEGRLNISTIILPVPCRIRNSVIITFPYFIGYAFKYFLVR